MRSHELLRPLVGLLASTLILPASANLVPELELDEQYGILRLRRDLEKRGNCGYGNWLQCPEGATCYTDYNTDAQCSYCPATAPPETAKETGTFIYYTTTYIQTNYQTVTITSSSWCPGDVVVTTTVECDQCPEPSTVTTTIDRNPTATVPAKGTSVIEVTVTISGTPEITTVPVTDSGTPEITTVPVTDSSTTNFVPPVTAATTAGVIAGVTTSSNGGLGAGAIAGIVIGVIAALIILLLVCLCFCAKELIDGFLGLFGLGKRKTVREEEIIEERRSRRDSRGGRTWFGTRPSRTSRVSNDKQRSGVGEWLGVAGALGALAIFLGLKRKRNGRNEKGSSSGYDYSDYYYSSSSKS